MMNIFNGSRQIDAEEIREILNTGNLYSGIKVNKFANEFKIFHKRDYGVATLNIGTAIDIALDLIGVNEYSEILCTPLACLTSIAPLLRRKIKIKWIEYIENTLKPDIEWIEANINQSTKAVFIYHFSGYAYDVTEIKSLCNKYGIKLIEDCNSSLGTTINGQRVGTVGHYSVYSFYPNRIINSIDGGFLFVETAEEEQRSRKLIKYGLDEETFRDQLGEINPRSDIKEIGFFGQMSEVAAALAISEFANINMRVLKLQKNYEYLCRKIIPSSEVEIFMASKFCAPVPWAFLLCVKDRRAFIAHMREHGIQASSIHIDLRHYSACNAVNAPTSTSLEHSIRGFDLVGVPCGWWLTERELEQLVFTISIFKSDRAN